VAPSRIGEALRTARARVGWSREALAYHSGVSWSAIAQIEAGRRKDVRLSSLAALAGALGVSVDYLIGTTTTIAPQLLEHRAITYGADDEFVAAARSFVHDGVERSHSVLAVMTKPKLGLLRDSLDDRSEEVEFADWDDWYRSPKAALDRYSAFVTQKFDDGAVWISVVAEAAWPRNSTADLATWMRYESLVNIAFASSPATLLCAYDERSYSAEAMADIHRTHPAVGPGDDTTANSTYQAPEDFLLNEQKPLGKIRKR
jgi:transcriptional regulator with XRE-family HTH domain